jgi:hypothetical protein
MGMVREGDWVTDPRTRHGRRGRVEEVREHPACLMRTVVVRWLALDGTHLEEEVEELEELEFGPLD